MSESPLYGGTSTARVRVHHLQQAKERGEKWAMLTAYDTYAAQVFEEAGIPVMLVGDSAGNVVLGHTSTVPVSVRTPVRLLYPPSSMPVPAPSVSVLASVSWAVLNVGWKLIVAPLIWSLSGSVRTRDPSTACAPAFSA